LIVKVKLRNRHYANKRQQPCKLLGAELKLANRPGQQSLPGAVQIMTRPGAFACHRDFG
jgi:hypothetical protein